MARYYVCGIFGNGTLASPYRPYLTEEIPDGTTWAANQLMDEGVPQPFFLMRVAASVPLLTTGYLIRIEIDEETGVATYYRANGQVLDIDKYDIGSTSVRLSKIGGALLFVQDWCGTVDAVFPSFSEG